MGCMCDEMQDPHWSATISGEIKNIQTQTWTELSEKQRKKRRGTWSIFLWIFDIPKFSVATKHWPLDCPRRLRSCTEGRAFMHNSCGWVQNLVARLRNGRIKPNFLAPGHVFLAPSQLIDAVGGSWNRKSAAPLLAGPSPQPSAQSGGGVPLNQWNPCLRAAGAGVESTVPESMAAHSATPSLSFWLETERLNKIMNQSAV